MSITSTSYCRFLICPYDLCIKSTAYCTLTFGSVWLSYKEFMKQKLSVFSSALLENISDSDFRIAVVTISFGVKVMLRILKLLRQKWILPFVISYCHLQDKCLPGTLDSSNSI